MSDKSTYRIRYFLLSLGISLLMILSAYALLNPALLASGESSAPDATLSGIISHEGNPVAGVSVTIGWTGEEHTIITAADGAYSVSGAPAPARSNRNRPQRQ